MKKFILHLIILVVILVLGGLVFLGVTGYDAYMKAIKETSISDKINEIQTEKNYTKIDDVSEMYKNAVIAVEDHRFYEHGGIDIIATMRAMARNIKSKELLEGGSTITQQLAKNTYFTQSKSFVRKVSEAFMALKYEKECDKDTIFELYINTSYFGDGYYNVKEASLGYFNKVPSELNDYEATLLAGVPNAPSIYAPTVNFELASQRQNQVLDKMVKYKYITEEKKKEIQSQKEQYKKYFEEKNEGRNIYE